MITPVTGKSKRVFVMRVSEDEYRYAKALSKRAGKCPRPNEGSVAHGFKYALREMAKNERIPLDK